MTQIERRQARIRRIRNQLERDRAAQAEEQSSVGPLPDLEAGALDMDARYHIGKTQNNPEQISLFLQKNQRDPVIKVNGTVHRWKSTNHHPSPPKNFLPKLKQHLLSRIRYCSRSHQMQEYPIHMSKPSMFFSKANACTATKSFVSTIQRTMYGEHRI